MRAGAGSVDGGGEERLEPANGGGVAEHLRGGGGLQLALQRATVRVVRHGDGEPGVVGERGGDQALAGVHLGVGGGDPNWEALLRRPA